MSYTEALNLRETWLSVQTNHRQYSFSPNDVQIRHKPLEPTVPYSSVTVSTQLSDTNPANWKIVAITSRITHKSTLKSKPCFAILNVFPIIHLTQTSELPAHIRMAGMTLHGNWYAGEDVSAVHRDVYAVNLYPWIYSSRCQFSPNVSLFLGQQIRFTAQMWEVSSYGLVKQTFTSAFGNCPSVFFTICLLSNSSEIFQR